MGCEVGLEQPKENFIFGYAVDDKVFAQQSFIHKSELLEQLARGQVLVMYVGQYSSERSLGKDALKHHTDGSRTDALVVMRSLRSSNRDANWSLKISCFGNSSRFQAARQKAKTEKSRPSVLDRFEAALPTWQGVPRRRLSRAQRIRPTNRVIRTRVHSA
jgi:hypothetical protein